MASLLVRTTATVRYPSNRTLTCQLALARALSYRPGLLEGNGLERTRWELLELGDAPVISHTVIMLAFEGGHMHGDAGCNGHSGQYVIAEPGVLSLYEIATTNMDCSSVGPAGVMEQEIAYHDMLQQVAGYRVSEARLELFDTQGEVLAVFERGVF